MPVTGCIHLFCISSNMLDKQPMQLLGLTTDCHDWQVDCAYYSDDLQEVSLDPGKELKQLLQSRGLSSLESSCPECFANQKKLVNKLVFL